MKKFRVGEDFCPKVGEYYTAILPNGREIPVVAVESDGRDVCSRCVLLRTSTWCVQSCTKVFYVSAEESIT